MLIYETLPLLTEDGQYMLKVVWAPVVNEHYKLLGDRVLNLRRLMMRCVTTSITIQEIRDLTWQGYLVWKRREEGLNPKTQ